MGLSKAELAENLFGKFGLSKHEIKQLIDTFFEEISFSLQNGEHVKISGFGNFELRNKNQRPGRNPKTGEDVPVTARRVVTFRSGQKLRCRIKQMQVNEEEKATNNILKK